MAKKCISNADLWPTRHITKKMNTPLGFGLVSTAANLFIHNANSLMLRPSS